MSDIGALYKEKFAEFIDGDYQTAFFDRDWFSPDSISYRANLRPSLKARGFDIYEFESSTFDADILSTKILADKANESGSVSSFRFLCEHINTSPASVIAVYRCSELTSKSVQLLSRLSRHLEHCNSDWKIVYFGSVSQIYPLNLKLLAPQVIQSFTGTKGDSITKPKQVQRPRRLTALHISLGAAAVLIVGWLLTNTLKQGNVGLEREHVTQLQTLPSAKKESVADVSSKLENTHTATKPVISKQVMEDMQEWTKYVAEFDEAMKRYSGDTEPLSSVTEKNDAEKPASSAKLATSKLAAAKMTTAMWQAANDGNTVDFKSTLKNKNAINAISTDGETALIIASLKGHSDLVLWLLENGAKVNNEDLAQKTALYYAAVNGHYDVADILLSHKANALHRSRLNKTPLMAAVHNRYHKLTELLIQAGADVNQQDHSGWSALFYAVWNGDEQAARLLIDAGAQVNVLDKDGHTVRDIASAKRNNDRELCIIPNKSPKNVKIQST